MMESKRVVFQFEVEGMEDTSLEEEKSLNATVEEFKEQSKMVKKKVMAVRSRVARMKHQQWRIKSTMDKDINRAEAITGEQKETNPLSSVGKGCVILPTEWLFQRAGASSRNPMYTLFLQE